VDINSMIRLVEAGAEQLAERCVEQLRHEEGMVDYLRLDEHELKDQLRRAYEEIGAYLDQPKNPILVEYWRELGRKRRKEGISITEQLRAIQLARSVLWQHVVEQGGFDSSVNMYQALNLYRQVMAFFDHGMIHAVEGWLEQK
jgi:hypothetical protein